MRIPVHIRVSDLALFHLRSLAKSNLVKRIAASTLVFLAIAVFRYGDGDGWIDNLLTFAVVIGAFGAFFGLIFILIVGMIASNGKENGELGSMIYVVEPIGFRVEGGQKPEDYAWDRVNDMGRSNDAIWLHIDNKQFRIFPKRSFSTDAELEQLWSLVRAYGPAA